MLLRAEVEVLVRPEDSFVLLDDGKGGNINDRNPTVGKKRMREKQRKARDMRSNGKVVGCSS